MVDAPPLDAVAQRDRVAEAVTRTDDDEAVLDRGGRLDGVRRSKPKFSECSVSPTVRKRQSVAPVVRASAYSEPSTPPTTTRPSAIAGVERRRVLSGVLQRTAPVASASARTTPSPPPTTTTLLLITGEPT